MKNKIFFVIAVVNVLICTVAYARGVNKELSQNLLRMHIIANSDSEYDQKLKLEVRDELVRMFSENKYEKREQVIESLESAQENVNKFLIGKNAEYLCSVSYEKSKFPQKHYKNLSIPAGEYECVRVVLGEGRGKNWWCVAYPPMCFTQSVIGEADGKINSLLSEDTYNIITSGKGEYKIKFKIVDIINSLCNCL